MADVSESAAAAAPRRSPMGMGMGACLVERAWGECVNGVLNGVLNGCPKVSLQPPNRPSNKEASQV